MVKLLQKRESDAFFFKLPWTAISTAGRFEECLVDIRVSRHGIYFCANNLINPLQSKPMQMSDNAEIDY